MIKNYLEIRARQDVVESHVLKENSCMKNEIWLIGFDQQNHGDCSPYLCDIASSRFQEKKVKHIVSDVYSLQH